MRRLKIPAILAAVLALVAGGAFMIIPSMIDTDPIVKALSDEVESMTGRPLVMGDVSVRLFPSAAIVVDGVAIRNDEASSKNHFLRAQQLMIHFSLLDALTGKTSHAADVELVSPNVELERFNTGGSNWQFIGAGEKTTQARTDLTLRVTNGTVNFTHHGHDYFETLNGLNGVFDVSPSRFTLNASANLRKKPIRVSSLCDVHRFDHFSAFDADCSSTAEQGGSRLEYKGRMVRNGDSLVNRGTVNMKSDDGRDWIDLVFGHGKSPFTDYYAQALPLEIEADSYVDDSRAVVNVTRVASGKSSGKGSVSMDMVENAADAAVVNLWFETLDLDALVPDGVMNNDAETNIFSLQQGLPDTVTADLQLQAQSLIYHKVNFANVVSKARFEHGEVIVSNMTLKTPSDGNIITLGRLIAKREGLEYDGQVEAYGDSLRALAPLVGIELEDIPETAFGKFRARLNLIARPDLTTISELRLVTGDRVQLAGGVNLYHGDKKRIDATIGLRYFDFAPFETLWLKGASLFDNPAEKPDHPFGFAWLKTLDKAVNLSVKLEDYTLFGKPGVTSSFVVAAAPNQLAVSDANVKWNGSQIGGRVSLRHEPSGVRPVISGQVNISQLRLGRLFMDTMAAGDEEKQATQAVWSRNNRIEMWPLHYVDGALELRINRLEHELFSAYNIRSNPKLENSRLSVKDAKVTLWGAPAQINLIVDSEVVPGVDLTFATQNSQLRDLFASFTDYGNITGSVTMMGKVSFSGLNYHDWIQNMNGYVTLDSRNIFVQGFNLPAIVRAIDSVRSVSGLANSIRMAQEKGATRIDNVNGTVALGQGKMDVSRLTLRSNESVGEITGSIDFQRWLMGMTVRLGLVTLAQTNYPFLNVNVRGSVSEPVIELDPKEVEAHLAREGL